MIIEQMEPRRQFKFLLDVEGLPPYLVKNVEFTAYGMIVSFYEQEDNTVALALSGWLADQYEDKNKSPVGRKVKLSLLNQKSEVDISWTSDLIDLSSFHYERLDYASTDAVVIKATLLGELHAVPLVPKSKI